MTAPKTTSSGEQGTSNILLAGGTGTVGREVVKGLVARGFAPLASSAAIIEHVRLDEARFQAAAAALPDFVIEAIVSSATMAQAGEYEVPDRLIQEKLGRRARRLEDWIEDHRSAFIS